jgi:hypothetical protein
MTNYELVNSLCLIKANVSHRFKIIDWEKGAISLDTNKEPAFQVSLLWDSGECVACYGF